MNAGTQTPIPPIDPEEEIGFMNIDETDFSSMNRAEQIRHLEVEGYLVGGKTGTADKPNPQGGYHDDKVIATFASVFPMDDPKYVLIVSLDEPEERSGDEPRRTAGWTAVPVGAEIIRRIAPLMGMRPEYFDDTVTPDALTLTRN